MAWLSGCKWGSARSYPKIKPVGYSVCANSSRFNSFDTEGDWFGGNPSSLPPWSNPGNEAGNSNGNSNGNGAAAGSANNGSGTGQPRIQALPRLDGGGI